MESILVNFDYVGDLTVDARYGNELEIARKEHPYEVHGQFTLGQLGIWFGVLNALEEAPIVTFEDDALLGEFFEARLNAALKELPEDADFFSLFIPRDSDHLWTSDKSVGHFVTKVYQRYGGVSMYYTEQGAKKIKALLERDGIRHQYDDTFYEYAKTGELNGYCLKPEHPDLVYITGEEESIVQNGEKIHFD